MFCHYFDKAPDFVQNKLYKCSSCERDVEIACLPGNKPLDEFKVCYKCLKQANPEAANGIVQHSGSKPIFVNQPPRTISVQAGENLILQCEATGNPPPKYQWFDGQRNPLDGKDQPTLVIENATHAVQGYYICRAVSCSDSKCSASSCYNFSEWTKVVVTPPCQPDRLKPREPPDHPTSALQLSKTRTNPNPPLYLQQWEQCGPQPLLDDPYPPPQCGSQPYPVAHVQAMQQQHSSSVQDVKSEVMHQQNGSFHSQPIPSAGELCMNMQPQPTLQSQSQLPHSLPQETQHEWLARGSTSQSGSLPKYPPPFQGLSQNYMPSSQPIGQQCPPSQPNEQLSAIPGQLQQHATVQQTQHQAQALHLQFTRPLDLPLQAPSLHTKPPMRLSPTPSLQTLLLSQSKPICHPDAQQASTLPPQQSQQALPDLKQFHSTPPQFKPVPKPRRNLKRPSGGFDSPLGMSKSHMQIQIATYNRSYAGYVFNTSRCIVCKGAIT